jgi:hypothetical protein
VVRGQCRCDGNGQSDHAYSADRQQPRFLRQSYGNTLPSWRAS